jgi:hypothetical protein
VVDRYRFETSLDGTHWTTQITVLPPQPDPDE